jgi:carbonic anhydrase
LNRASLLGGLGAAAIALPCCSALRSTAAAAEEWGYSGEDGPQNWGKLDSDFKTCSIGLQQSPINIASPVSARIGGLTTDYKATPMRIINNGHTVQVNYAPGSVLTVRGRRLVVQQFHFHAPSEHTLAGKHFPMEMHVVHKDDSGLLGVLGVFLQEGAANPAFASILAAAPKTAGPERTVAGETIDVARLVGNTATYFEYLGSLTTPPCSENVSWFVLTQPSSVSADQVATFKTLVPKNNRPVQNLNARLLFENV